MQPMLYNTLTSLHRTIDGEKDKTIANANSNKWPLPGSSLLHTLDSILGVPSVRHEATKQRRSQWENEARQV